MTNLLVPVILAGVQGTGLWSMSHAGRPKQFPPTTAPTSLFQRTVERVTDCNIYAPSIVVTNSDYRFIVAEQTLESGIPLTAIPLEPDARNTAEAIAAAAVYAPRDFGPEAILHILPSDHEVLVDACYWSAVHLAAEAVAAGQSATFGVELTHPVAAFGYVKTQSVIGGGACRFERLVEKQISSALAISWPKGGTSGTPECS